MIKIVVRNSGRVANQLGRFVDVLPKKYLPAGRKKYAREFRDRAIQFVDMMTFWGRWATGKHRPAGLKHPSSWEIIDGKNETTVIPHGVDDWGYDYAGAVNYGTKPHEILNNWAWGRKGRKHPGARPMRFMENTTEIMKVRTHPIFNKEILLAIKEVGLA